MENYGPEPPENGKKDELTIFERFDLSLSLREIGARLKALEAAAEPAKQSYGPGAQFALELLRILLGGWTVFGLLILILFYSPIRAALNQLPDKVKNANEIHLGEFSLKGTIREEALRAGASELSESLPKLSNGAIELLLKTPTNNTHEGLIGYAENPAGMVVSVSLPSPAIIQTLAELEKVGLIQIFGAGPAGGQPMRTSEIQGIIDDFRMKNPGHAADDSRPEVAAWALDHPVAPASMPSINWTATDTGKQAIDIVVKAIAAELNRKPEKAE
jgi:hypothetical protein